MAKVPRAGNVKTRLQPFLSAEQCEKLAEAFLFDAVEKARGFSDRLIIAFAPASEENYFAGFDFENLTLVEQRGTDLGEKMFRAFEFAFETDLKASVVMIGTDSPTFPPRFFERAFELLESGAETVLGESADGGFYLIGAARKIQRELFENIEWSSPRVYRQMTENIERLKISFGVIPSWYDVDTPDDLRRLRDECARDEKTRKIAARTFQWLNSNANFSISEPENKFSTELRD